MNDDITHIVNFFRAWGLAQGDRVLCEHAACSRWANDIHHIKYRSAGGTDDFDNLIAVCRLHHNQAHSGELSVDEMLEMKHWPRGERPEPAGEIKCES